MHTEGSACVKPVAGVKPSTCASAIEPSASWVLQVLGLCLHHHTLTCSSALLLLACCPLSDKCFISKGYDATSHFETTVEDVLSMYRRITGKDLDLTAKDPSAVEA